MKGIRAYFPYLLLVGLGTLFLSQHFPDIFANPNSVFLVRSGDGLHNYFTFAYFLKFDTGYWFTGMTYPFGEHHLFTDGHFLLAWILKGFSGVFNLEDQSVAYIHRFIFLGFVLGLVYLYKILKYYGAATWYAIAVALIVTLLSPQVQRIIGHYSLAQIGFIPMLWYALIRMQEPRRTWWRLVVPVFLILFYGLIHPYYFPMGFFFLSSFWFVQLLGERSNWRSHRRKALELAAVILGTFVLYYGFTSISDPVTDRHPAPYGLFHYHATFESVFLPSFGPILDLWRELTVVKTGHPVESLSYVGVPGFLCLVFLGIRSILGLYRGRGWRAFRFTTHRSMQYLLLASVLVLLLSMAFPFVQFPILLEWFGTFRQFRSLGRFAWMFYYVFTVFSALYFFRVAKTVSRKGLMAQSLSILLAILLLWGIEATINVRRAAAYIKTSRGVNTVFRSGNKDYTRMLAESGYEASDFQALLPLPYFNNGSEKLYIQRSDKANTEAYKCAFDTGIPILTLHSPRTSISQSLGLAQLLSSDLIRKEILPTLKKNGKPVLLIDTREALQTEEQALIQKAELLLETPFIRLFRLDLDAFEDSQQEVANDFLSEKDRLYQRSSLLIDDSSAIVIYKDYNNLSPDHTFLGSGAFHTEKEENVVLFEGELAADSMTNFELSCWIFADPDISSFPALFLECFPSDGRPSYGKNYNPKFHTELLGSWARASIDFDYYPGDRLKVFLFHENEKLPFRKHWVDELLIRPSAIDVYQNNCPPYTLIKNNYPLLLKE